MVQAGGRRARRSARPAAGARERVLLDRVQAGLALTRRPWRTLAREVGSTERACLAAVRRLAARGLIREIGPLFDTHRLGYASTLVAAEVAPARLEAVAAQVSAHPGVSHNYQRAHRYNLWFTLAVPPGGDLKAELARLAAQPGVVKLLELPMRRRFKLAVRLGAKDAPAAAPSPPAAAPVARAKPDEDLIRAAQRPFPLVLEPFRALARRAGLAEGRLLDGLRDLRARGYLRRFAAVLRHRAAGYRENWMVVWRVPAAQMEAAGRRAAEFGCVSHCYERPAYPDWPYNLYTMLHARTRAAAAAQLRRLRAALAPFDAGAPLALRSEREFQKRRLRYFAGGAAPGPA